MLAGAAVMPVRPASAQSTLTPEEALKALTDGNERYVSGQLQSLNEDLSILKAKTAEKQEPFAAILSCADSRVPVEFVFDQSIGHLFVVRVAGNITTPEITASLEYGVAVLGTKVLMVLGHGNCGAVKATIEGKAVPGQISALYAPIRPAVDAAGGDLDAAIDANAMIQATTAQRGFPRHRRSDQGGETEGRAGALRHCERKSLVARLGPRAILTLAAIPQCRCTGSSAQCRHQAQLRAHRGVGPKPENPGYDAVVYVLQPTRRTRRTSRPAPISKRMSWASEGQYGRVSGIGRTA